MLIFFIRIYQLTISPWLPCRCRFTPTCSHYAVEALKKRGLWVGSALAAWRIMRCQPFCRGGYDPVPEKKSIKNSRSMPSERVEEAHEV